MSVVAIIVISVFIAMLSFYAGTIFACEGLRDILRDKDALESLLKSMNESKMEGRGSN
jgi:ubiquinone biosynthesis protein Coq4